MFIVALTACSLCAQGSINHSVASLGIVYAIFVSTCYYDFKIVNVLQSLFGTELYRVIQ